MSYLEQFARNKRRKEPSTVLTARLPDSLYGDFKERCDELGLSISEAIYLLVEREITADQKAAKETAAYISEHIQNGEEAATNTKPIIKHTAKIKMNTKRFTMKQWKVDGELPCPICSSWTNAKSFSRHAKKHHMTTQTIFTNQEYIEKANEMVEQRKAK
ncbi:hypothetical protein RRU94_02145 [Domibacillus sp. DTU_2020_1001157_1_SI_ALB_TIR_016]|uniref:hypothetical protein n=1 Tax=Domibacillus sp. DTU_2020_1001157_1_SI_ALB_TIR_016 TaxID=3077789 RepID=UPI0028E32AB7|nr:hypothetical protein [Domibacillus sp. DTU_2020_1001157_1_SI_ALB_TIR_016]WNS78769.1 hypothetical protein RRU94_02145 [Domibacillus sp. DTU_2020_1001157_1_SI_ALB_TIR_016]